MLRGVAHAGGDDTPEDRYGVVVALSNLTQTLADAEAGVALTSAAETCATLLRAGKVAVFVRDDVGHLSTGGSAGIDGHQGLLSPARAIAQEALASNAPLIIPNVHAAGSPQARRLSESGVASLACVPMRVSESSVGAIVVMSEDLRAFSPAEIEILHVIASHAALAAIRSGSSSSASAEKQEELIRLADRKIQELSLLNQVSEAVSSTLELDALLEIALEESLSVVGADAGSIMLINEDTRKLEIAASHGLDRKWVENTSQEVGKSIAGWVAQHGESVLVTDAHKDARFEMPFYRESITSSASVPLKARGVVIGVLNVNTVRTERVFDERDLELLATVANQVAVAIDNARLYSRVNRRTKQLSSLLQISKTVTSTLNLDEVLHRLTGEICALLQLDVCTVLLLDELSGRLRFGHGSGLRNKPKYVYHDLAAPIALKVKETGRKLVVNDVSTSQQFGTDPARSLGLRNAVGIPLKNHGRLVAIAVGFAREPRSFAKSQLDIMRPLGELAGVAIHNARVYRRKYRIAEMLQQRLIGSEAPHIDGVDIGCKLVPAREVGGDYYDIIKIGPDRLGVVLSDVSGSDVDAAEYTTMGKHVLRVYARECQSPAEVLTKTNNLICEDTAAEVFISSFYGVVDVQARRLTYANAGCEPAILHRASDGSVSQLSADGILLGICSGCQYEAREVILEPGDVVVLYTDGLTEACVENRRFGSGAVMDLVRSNAHKSAREITECLHEALLEFVHGQVTDDVAIVAIKVP